MVFQGNSIIFIAVIYIILFTGTLSDTSPTCTVIQGVPGLNGRDGRDGINGLKGDPGPPGEPGTPGIRGLAGPPGKQGPIGNPGSTGLRGEPGDPGVRGIEGPPGKLGPIGVKGEKGEADRESARRIAALESKIISLEKSLSWLKNVVLLQHELSASEDKLYVSTAKIRSFAPALAICKKYGGILPSPISDQENSILYNLASYTEKEFFLGINDRDKEGQFVLGDGHPITYKKWNVKEPNGWNGENCVQIYPPGKWIDISCDQSKSVTCEFPIP